MATEKVNYLVWVLTGDPGVRVSQSLQFAVKGRTGWCCFCRLTWGAHILHSACAILSPIEDSSHSLQILVGFP